MRRAGIKFLNEWLISGNRKPLVLRGARQVGKTWLVRHFAKEKGLQLVEVNFERRPQLNSLFSSNDPKQILLNLTSVTNQPIDTKKALLFLDEIQAAPEILAKLRWFAEDLPELPVIAAGSLLEFVLAEHSFSMPVGRISYMHLEPLSFEEFLLASDKSSLLEYLTNYSLEAELPAAIHEQLMHLFKEYTFIGGMPAAVSSWIHKKSLQEVNQIHHDLMATYRDDFAKYSARLPVERFDEVILSVPKSLGEKFVFSKVNPEIRSSIVKQALDLLCKARICYRVNGTAGNGVPLEAEIQEKYLKIIFLDVGLCSAALGLTLDQLYMIKELTLINHGGIAEQLVGQSLRTVFPFYVEPSLFYWHREEKGSNAEVDYLIQHHSKVIPIEVKAGSTGSMKSLQVFMGLKGYKMAVRINSAPPSLVDVEVKTPQGSLVQYKLLSLPFYLIEQIHRLLG